MIAGGVADVLVGFGECAYDDLDCQTVRNVTDTIDIDRVSRHYELACVSLELTNLKMLFYNIYKRMVVRPNVFSYESLPKSFGRTFFRKFHMQMAFLPNECASEP